MIGLILILKHNWRPVFHSTLRTFIHRFVLLGRADPELLVKRPNSNAEPDHLGTRTHSRLPGSDGPRVLVSHVRWKQLSCFFFVHKSPLPRQHKTTIISHFHRAASSAPGSPLAPLWPFYRPRKCPKRPNSSSLEMSCVQNYRLGSKFTVVPFLGCNKVTACPSQSSGLAWRWNKLQPRCCGPVFI